MWSFIMESPHFNTSSIRDKWHSWKRRWTSTGRYVISIAAVRTSWKVVARLCGMQLLSAKRPGPPGRWENPNERRFGEPCKGPIIPFGAVVENHPISPKDQSRLHQFCKKLLLGILLGYELIAGGIWKKIFWLRIWKSWTHQTFIFEESTRKKYW